MLPWLEMNVHEVLDRVDRGEPLVVEYENKRSKRYQGFLPKSICRHILLSDVKDVAILPDVSVKKFNFSSEKFHFYVRNFVFIENIFI